MTTAESFFSTKEEQQIISAIKRAEKNTSGEIRVHIDETPGTDALADAQKVFYALKMEKTKDRNGVLFYLSIQDKQLAICGDIGIDENTPNDFWEKIKETVLKEFQKGHFAKGLIVGIKITGEALKEYFPIEKNDIDELPNELSFGKKD